MNYLTLTFEDTQRIQQQSGEHWKDLHERLREQVIKSIRTVRSPTRIITPSWYTFDASKILRVPNAFALCTSTCKHETPYQIFVGKRQEGFMKQDATQKGYWVYEIQDLGRELTLDEKNEIYDKM